MITIIYLICNIWRITTGMDKDDSSSEGVARIMFMMITAIVDGLLLFAAMEIFPSVKEFILPYII